MRDAFDGILPVTDPKMMRSLNGEWQLKVVQGISDDRTVPMADETLYTLIRRLKPVVEQYSDLKIESDRSRAYRLTTK